MISIIRRSFKSRIYKIVLWITLFAVAGVFSLVEMVRMVVQGGVQKKWVLKVNSDTIDYPTFERKVADEQERMRMIRAQYGQYADLIFQLMHASLNPAVAAMHSLIRQSLLNQVARKMSLHISSDEIKESLRDIAFIERELSDVIPMFLIQAPGVVNTGMLRTYLQRAGISAAEFDRLVAQGIKRYTLTEVVSAADYIPLFELQRRFVREYSPKKYSIGTISYDRVLAEVKKTTPTEQELKDYFEQQNSKSGRYYIPEQRSGQLASFDAKGMGISVAEDALDQYYQQNKVREFTSESSKVQVRRILFKIENPQQSSAVREKAEKIRAELVAAPATFAAKAKELSEDKDSAAQGGLLPSFSKGEREQAIERAAFIMKEDLEISPVLSTTQGLEIIQRVSKKAAVYKPFAQVKEEIRQKLARQKFADVFTREVRSILGQADGQQAALASFAQAKRATSRTVSQMPKDQSKLATTLFSLKSGESSFYIDGDQGMVVTLTGILERHLPTWDAIKNAVKEDWYRDKAQQELNKQIASLAEQVKKGSWQGVSPEHTGWLKKDDAQQVAALEKKGISAAKLFQLENAGSVASYIDKGIGYVIRVDEIKPFDQELFNQKRSDLKATSRQQRSTLVMGGFVASLWRSATIENNDSVLHSEL